MIQTFKQRLKIHQELLLNNCVKNILRKGRQKNEEINQRRIIKE